MELTASKNGQKHLKNNMDIQLDTIESAIADIKAGKVIIVVDDEDRENEGDFICAAETITPEIVNFMATHGRGLICTPIEEKRADELGLQMMVSSNTALHETAFTVSIDLIGQGCTTGISAYDRSTGIKALVYPETKPSDYARPGHIFPLRAKKGGVLRRVGHTEAAVDFARLAGLYPAGVLVEILNEDGTMARLPQLIEIAKKHNLKIVSIDDLVAYRLRSEQLIELKSSVTIDSKYGELEILAYEQSTTGDIHLAIKKGDLRADQPALVRVHSVDRLTEIFKVMLDKKESSLSKALSKIGEEGNGLLVLMRHHEKETDVLDLLKILKDPANAQKFKKPTDYLRDYGTGAQIIRSLGIRKIRLITNNPNRKVGLIGYGLEVVENVEL
ncbi:MAG: 3,4-dihydroxy-2-butanone-4-phosphate synthase [Bacteroidota bacterium]